MIGDLIPGMLTEDRAVAESVMTDRVTLSNLTAGTRDSLGTLIRSETVQATDVRARIKWLSTSTGTVDSAGLPVSVSSMVAMLPWDQQIEPGWLITVTASLNPFLAGCRFVATEVPIKGAEARRRVLIDPI